MGDNERCFRPRDYGSPFQVGDHGAETWPHQEGRPLWKEHAGQREKQVERPEVVLCLLGTGAAVVAGAETAKGSA